VQVASIIVNQLLLLYMRAQYLLIMRDSWYFIDDVGKHIGHSVELIKRAAHKIKGNYGNMES